jgi:predicted metal-dependent enzyme (double-stranded beta helix superfamily)
MDAQYSIPDAVSKIELNRLADFRSRPSDAVGTSRDQSAVVHRGRATLTAALTDSEFLLDCAEASIRAIAASAGSVWTNSPLIDNDAQDYWVRLVYWPPKFSNSPHENTFWTVTGVLSNALTFRTYARRWRPLPSLESDKETRAVRGQVGYILPPCIHHVANESTFPSISFHILSGPELTTGSYESGRTAWCASSGQPEPRILTVSQAVAALIPVFVSFPGERCLDILDGAFYLPDLPTRLSCAKPIGRRDPRRAGSRLLEPSKRCDTADSKRLRHLADALLHVRA